MAIERFVRAYLANTQQPSVEGVLGYIDAHDKSVPTLAELNEALKSVKGGESLHPVSEAAYEEAMKKNHEQMLSRFEKKGISREKVQAVLANFSKPPDLSKPRK